MHVDFSSISPCAMMLFALHLVLRDQCFGDALFGRNIFSLTFRPHQQLPQFSAFLRRCRVSPILTPIHSHLISGSNSALERSRHLVKPPWGGGWLLKNTRQSNLTTSFVSSLFFSPQDIKICQPECFPSLNFCLFESCKTSNSHSL